MGRVFPPNTAASATPPPLGVDVPAISLGVHSSEVALGAVGPSNRTVTGFWISVVGGGVGITADDTDGLQFTVNCRSADNTVSQADYTSTATTGSGGVGSVPLLGIATYAFPTPLVAPANGVITIAIESFGAGLAVGATKMGVLFQ